MPSTPSLVESTRPVESATVTASAFMPLMLEATRFTIACTCSGPRVTPAAVLTMTEAVGGLLVGEDSLLRGIARWTTAAWTRRSPRWCC